MDENEVLAARINTTRQTHARAVLRPSIAPASAEIVGYDADLRSDVGKTAAGGTLLMRSQTNAYSQTGAEVPVQQDGAYAVWDGVPR